MKITTPLRTINCTTLEWLNGLYKLAESDLKTARWIDPTGDYKLIIEVNNDN